MIDALTFLARKAMQQAILVPDRRSRTCVGFISDLDVDHLSSLIVPNQSSESQTQLPMSSVRKAHFVPSNSREFRSEQQREL